MAYLSILVMHWHRVVVGMEQLLKGPGCKKVPTRIWCDDDAISVAQSFDKTCVVPIFTVSAVGAIGFEIRIMCGVF